MNNSIQHIIFDLGQVFIQVDMNVFVNNFSAAFGIDPSELTKDGYDEVHKQFMLGTIDGEDFHRMTCEHFDHALPFEQFKSIWESMLTGEVPGTVAIAERLQQMGYAISLLSNTDTWHYHFSLKNIPFLQRLHNNFLSYEKQMKKPDVEIFEAATRDLGAKPETCLFIDDLPSNVAGARAAGLHAIQFSDAEQLRSDLKQLGINV